VKRDYIRTLVRRQSQADADEIVTAWNALARGGIGDIEAEGIPKDKIVVQRVADVRYFGEGHEVQVDIPAGLEGAAAIEHMWKGFHRVHERNFGYHYEGEQDVELVNLRVQARGMQHRPSLKPAEAGGVPTRPFAHRQAYWRQTGWVECPLYRRADLAVGQSIDGPAIIEEYGSTAVAPEGWTIGVDGYRNLILRKTR
jgi:N-methylhydantoinase A